MSIRVPRLTGIPCPPAPYRSKADSIGLLADFLKKGKGKTLILTGAGVSVDSGIKSYRGVGGSYNDTTKIHRPIFYGEFIASEAMRRRYWARSYLGFPAVRVAEPNPTHYAIAALQKLGVVQALISQNVDGLHHKAVDSSFETYLNSPSAPTSPAASSKPTDPPILELHGTLRHAHCLKCDTIVGRDKFQDQLSELNPLWSQYADSVSDGSRESRLNPDGDVELGGGVRYEDFVVPNCENCGGSSMKPKVTFFGESLSPAVRDLSKEWVSDSTQLLIIGSSLATFSAFRLVRQKIEEGGKVLLLNVGESRGDLLATERIGWDGGCVEIVPDAARAIFEDMRSGLDQEKMEEIEILLRSGNIKKVPEEGFSTS